MGTLRRTPGAAHPAPHTRRRTRRRAPAFGPVPLSATCATITAATLAVVRIELSPNRSFPTSMGHQLVLRVLEHLRRTGHGVPLSSHRIRLAEAAAARVHDGIRIHRVQSRMFLKITSLPLGVPHLRMAAVLRGFDPHVVHLASPALLGYGGLHPPRATSALPTVAVFQTDVAGFAAS